MAEALFHELALPTDPALDSFDCGDTEVNNYFKERIWFNKEKGKAAPPAYVFRTHSGGQVVGFVAMDFRNVEHPDDQSKSRGKYLTIYALGANKQFHGKQNPLKQKVSFAASILEIAEGYAMKKPACVGIYLWVRSTNQRAITFYTKIGFTKDPAGPIQRDDGAPHITMRKLLS